MLKHAGVVTGAAMAAVGLVLAVAALAGFAVGLPAIVPSSALGASWFMVAVVLLISGAFVALAARGVELDAEEHAPARIARPVRRLHPTR